MVKTEKIIFDFNKGIPLGQISQEIEVDHREYTELKQNT